MLVKVSLVMTTDLTPGPLAAAFRQALQAGGAGRQSGGSEYWRRPPACLAASLAAASPASNPLRLVTVYGARELAGGILFGRSSAAPYTVTVNGRVPDHFRHDRIGRSRKSCSKP